MTKTSSKIQPLVKKVPSKFGAKVESWNNFVPKFLFKLKKGSQAGVVLDKNNSPRFFIFDVFAFLDVLSKIDDSLIDKLSDEEYVDKSVNPAWWLIGEIEERLPLGPEYVAELKKEVAEAKKDIANGETYSFQEIVKELNFK
ncbi:MAG: hypothetical protein ABH896_04505 [Candidatus Jacksonbacteria bacterium]